MFVIIVGGGKVGSHLATMLLGGGQKVRLIESRKDAAEQGRPWPDDTVVSGSGTDLQVLEAAGIRAADVVAAVTGTDETNLVVAGLARTEFNVPRVIARINDPRNAWLFTPQLGVDVALNQADLMAHLIAEEMSVGEMMTLLKLRKGQFSLVEEKVHPTSAAAGKSIMAIDLPLQSVIAAVIRKGKLLVPRGELVLLAGDEVLAVVHSADVARLASTLGPVKQPGLL